MGGRTRFLARVAATCLLLPAAVVSPAAAESQPIAVAAVGGDRSLTVSWTPVAYEGPLTVEYSVYVTTPDAAGPFLGGSWSCTSPPAADEGGVPRVTGTSCVVAGLENGRTYYASVQAEVVDRLDPELGVRRTIVGWSGRDAAVVTLCCGIPSAPLRVRVVDNGAGRATVAWDPSSSTGGAPTLVYRATVPGTAFMCESASTTCLITGLPYGLRIVVRVSASNRDFTGPLAESAAVTMKAPTPGAPRLVRAQRVGRSAVVTWRPSPGIAASDLRRYEVRSSPRGLTCRPQRATRCVVTGLVPGRRYSLQVRGRGIDGAGPWSQPSPFIEVPLRPPPLPAPSPPPGSTPPPKPEQELT